MKLLLDSCVWGGAKAALQAYEHDVVWCGDWDHDPGDEAVLAGLVNCPNRDAQPIGKTCTFPFSQREA